MKWTLRDAHGLDDVLTTLSTGRVVYALERANKGSYKLSKAPNWQTGHHTLGSWRQSEPLKSLFFPAREFIGRWGQEMGAEVDSGIRRQGRLSRQIQLPEQNQLPEHSQLAAEGRIPERIVFGMKNCDLSSLAIFDQVFLKGVAKDPYYAEARENTILVSSDCSDHLDVCFCPAVGEQPWAEKGFDINIAQSPEGCVIEDGSARGAKLIMSVEHLLEEAGPELLVAVHKQREKHRKALVDSCNAHGVEPGTDFKTAIADTFESGLWADFAKDCVECGACNFICCTCHCFLLADGVDADGTPARSKLWDACLYRDFARTAGGGNPRPLRAERLRNRFDKKFIYFPDVMGRYACDGCGRCTEACIANIDIRDVLKRAVDESAALHADTGNH